MSSAFSPLATILTQNKLTKNNFIDWKRNLDIVLTTEDHVYVLTTPCLRDPRQVLWQLPDASSRNGGSQMEWLIAIC